VLINVVLIKKGHYKHLKVSLFLLQTSESFYCKFMSSEKSFLQAVSAVLN
jgi:hypothetical protein